VKQLYSQDTLNADELITLHIIIPTKHTSKHVFINIRMRLKSAFFYNTKLVTFAIKREEEECENVVIVFDNGLFRCTYCICSVQNMVAV